MSQTQPTYTEAQITATIEKQAAAIEASITRPCFAARMIEHGASAEVANNPQTFKRAVDLFEQQSTDLQSQAKEASSLDAILSDTEPTTSGTFEVTQSQDATADKYASQLATQSTDAVAACESWATLQSELGTL